MVPIEIKDTKTTIDSLARLNSKEDKVLFELQRDSITRNQSRIN